MTTPQPISAGRHRRADVVVVPMRVRSAGPRVVRGQVPAQRPHVPASSEVTDRIVIPPQALPPRPVEQTDPTGAWDSLAMWLGFPRRGERP